MIRKLKRELGLIEVICVSSGVMISSGLFVLPAIAYTYSGPAVVLAYLLGSLLIIPTILAKSELVTAMPITGGIYIFADRSMGPLMGTIGGLTAWISLAFKSAFSLLAMGIFVILLNPDISELHIKLISVACCLFFTYINIKGVKMSGRLQTIFVILLITFLIIYAISGVLHIEPDRYVPFAPKGFKSIIATAGFIFISFSGTTKVTAISGEVKNPGRILPLGIFYSWGIVSLLYIVVVFVTVGILEPAELGASLTPISLGGERILGRLGLILMTCAGLLAFISTGNAGLLAASRNPLAMSKDELLPQFLGHLSKRRTPVNALLFTAGIMVVVILFLDFETFVKTASVLKLTLFIIANVSLIFMREANMHHYRPQFKAPFYPWAPIIGIVSYAYLITQMGWVPNLIALGFILTGIAWYYLYVRGKIKREYAMLYLIERVTDLKTSDHLLEEELREILIERDDISGKWFKNLIKRSALKPLAPSNTNEDIAQLAAQHFFRNQKAEQARLLHRIALRLDDPDIIVQDGVACLSVKTTMRRQFKLLMLKSQEGIVLSNSDRTVHAIFIILYSDDEWNRQIHAISRIIEQVEKEKFLNHWKDVDSADDFVEKLL